MLKIEFARQSVFASLGFRVGAAGLILLLLASGLFAGLEFKNREINAELSRIRGQISQRETPPAPPPPLSPEEEQSIRRASVELSIEWGRLLDAIEVARTDPITLMGLEGEAPGSTLRLTGSGRSYADVLEFVEHLQNREVLYDVLLLSHQASSPAPDSPIKFVITARWRVN